MSDTEKNEQSSQDAGQSRIGSSDLLAFEVVIDDNRCYTFAKTAAAARFNAVNSMREVGYIGPMEWPSVKAKRAPRYDKHASKWIHGRRCYSPDFIEC